MTEPTEMAGVAESETEAAYAWALDYDGYDELPTVPTQRLTPRRITSLGLAASLTVIAAAGAVMLFVAHDANRPIAQAPSPHVETSASPSPLPPPPPPPRPPNPAAEARFVADVYANIPTADIPGGRPTDARLVAYGYQACSVMDQYPNPASAAEPFYAAVSRDAGYTRDPAKISKTSAANEVWFMTIAAQDLCNAPVAAPPPPVTVPAAISRAPFLGQWSRNSVDFTLAPDGSVYYTARLGFANGTSWSATWSPMTETTAMIVMTTELESHGDTTDQWLHRRHGEAFTFTLRPDGYATITGLSDEPRVLCPQRADFHDTKGLCGA